MQRRTYAAQGPGPAAARGAAMRGVLNLAAAAAICTGGGAIRPDSMRNIYDQRASGHRWTESLRDLVHTILETLSRFAANGSRIHSTHQLAAIIAVRPQSPFFRADFAISLVRQVECFWTSTVVHVVSSLSLCHLPSQRVGCKHVCSLDRMFRWDSPAGDGSGAAASHRPWQTGPRQAEPVCSGSVTTGRPVRLVGALRLCSHR